MSPPEKDKKSKKLSTNFRNSGIPEFPYNMHCLTAKTTFRGIPAEFFGISRNFGISLKIVKSRTNYTVNLQKQNENEAGISEFRINKTFFFFLIVVYCTRALAGVRVFVRFSRVAMPSQTQAKRRNGRRRNGPPLEPCVQPGIRQ